MQQLSKSILVSNNSVLTSIQTISDQFVSLHIVNERFECFVSLKNDQHYTQLFTKDFCVQGCLVFDNNIGITSQHRVQIIYNSTVISTLIERGLKYGKVTEYDEDYNFYNSYLIHDMSLNQCIQSMTFRDFIYTLRKLNIYRATWLEDIYI